ncbi:MAG: CvpA family protein [Dehalococcoidia bacterium]|nr:hypothetical protein [Chloroflexota bacterium]MBT9159704.1 hypothetical protein [Chloroflexota bacterium]MBT9162625.1 hypothetical protein [Chloroflexota bacterium]
MNWLDIAIIVVLGIVTVLGLKWGLIKSLVPLVGVILGIILAGRFHHLLAARLGFIESESLAGIIAFILILIAVYVTVFVLGSILRGMLNMVFLGWVDRLGGAVFGFATGWIICSVVVVLLARYVALPAEIPEMPVAELGEWLEQWRGLEAIRQSVTTAIGESKLAMVKIDIFPIILGLLPERLAVVRDFFGN